MIKDNFTITPEFGRNNGEITVVANTNPETKEYNSIIKVQGGSISKSVSLTQKARLDPYTPWAKRVNSNWDLTENWLFPDIYYSKTSQTLNKFPIDKAWLFDGNIAEMFSAINGAYIDMCNSRKIPINTAGGKMYNYNIDDSVVKTNGCWAWMYLAATNLVNAKKIIITTNDANTAELRINHINVKVLTSSPNLTQLEEYVRGLGWKLEMINDNANNSISFTPIENADIRARLYIRMARNPNEKDVSDCLNLILV
jgi:hypothetical protein